ncbi:hypothetical protein OIV83_005720 [Microbotryomycetes sp. JL201]|nr:hypothetical protein OIV83_005720 [Microbotryomycetes sp. JL201]
MAVSGRTEHQRDQIHSSDLSRLEYDPAVLFNRATLHIHVPDSPPPRDLLPQTSATTDTRIDANSRNCSDADSDYLRRVDEWVTSIARSPERKQAYYDERVPFYLVIKLPSSPELNRTQALLFLLPSAEAPHLSLTADASYVEGTYADGRAGAQRSSSLPAGLGLSTPQPSLTRAQPELVTRSASTAALASTVQGPQVSPSPSPVPAARPQDSPLISDSTVVPLWSTAFASGDGKRCQMKSHSKVDTEFGRVWVGQLPEKVWAGVWEFRGPIPYVASNLMAPKLCLTVTMTFRDDPRIADLLERTSTRAVDGSDNRPSLADILQEEDDYIVESLDDVNLLAGLSASFGEFKLHLPASRLPEPLAPSATSGRRLSRFSLALPGVASTDAPVHPTMRRSARRILDVKSVISVRMRTVPCPVDALTQSNSLAASASLTVGDHRETQGLVMCVEVEGSDETSPEQFDIEGIDIIVSPGPAGLGDIEVRRIPDLDLDGRARFPFTVRGGEQHNFLYAVKFTSEAAHQSLTRMADASTAVTAVPVEVASSPSQRFNARFGDESVPGPNWNADEQAAKTNSAGPTNAWTRNVSIIVRGRPLIVEPFDQGFAVQDNAKGKQDHSEATRTYPTSVFASTWNSVLDISPFAVRTPPKQALFDVPRHPPAVQLALSAGQKVAADPHNAATYTKRQLQSAPTTNFELIAGSKRHTIASLSTLAQKVPRVIRPSKSAHTGESNYGAAAFQTESNGLSAYFRAPASASSAAASAAARFFSLPSGEAIDNKGAYRSSLDWTPSAARTDTPTSADAPSRHFSLPALLANAATSSSETGSNAATESKRDSWRHGGAAGVVDSQPTSVLPPPHLISAGSTQTTKDTRSSTAAITSVPEDNILVSVSLLPLRGVKNGTAPNGIVRSKAKSMSKGKSGERLSVESFESRTPSPSSTDGEDDNERDGADHKPDNGADNSVEHTWRTPRIGLLDVFLVEVFVLNRSSQVKRFTVGVPVGATGRSAAASGSGGGQHSAMATLIALENDVRIGPLAPNSCASVRLRFLAIRPGAHVLDELRVIDVATGLETRLKEPLWVIREMGSDKRRVEYASDDDDDLGVGDAKAQHESPDAQNGTKHPVQPAKKKPRTGIACSLCRQKRIKCDVLPLHLSTDRISPEQFLLNQDRRKPYTKAMVQALELRINTLESQLAAANKKLGLASSAPSPRATGPTIADGWNMMPTAVQPRIEENGGHMGSLSTATVVAEVQPSRPGTSHGQRPLPIDAFQGGLALNSHGELRYYGPTSSYRTVLADAAVAAASNETVEAIRAYSLTRAPIPAALPAEPVLPRRPPDLEPELKAKMFSLAFEHCFSQFDLVPWREFLVDSDLRPFERTPHSSPFLINCVLAMGARYLEPEEAPSGCCSIPEDPDTRGDVFATYARHLLDQELYCPAISTIRGLLVLGLYLAMRGFDGPCQMFTSQAFRLVEDFGLHLGVHRLTVGKGYIPEELNNTRRNTFWTAYSVDLSTSIFIGRKLYFPPDHLDIDFPHIVPDVDYDEPMYRSSALHWSSQLCLIGARIMHQIYSLRSDVSFAQRQKSVPDLHLQLEKWHHALPNHLRASTSDPGKAPHQHVIALNMYYSMLHIQLHRPFFRRHSRDPTTNVSTDKCLTAASNIVRLVKLLRKGSGLRFTAPSVQHSAFCAGTILAISAAEDRISDNPRLDRERRLQAQKDLSTIVECLKEIGKTWTTAHTSATVLEAIMTEWTTSGPSATAHAHESSTRQPVPAEGSGQQALVLTDAQPEDGFKLPHEHAAAAAAAAATTSSSSDDALLSAHDQFFQTFRDVVDFEPPSASAASSFPFLFPSWQLEDSPPQNDLDLTFLQ